MAATFIVSTTDQVNALHLVMYEFPTLQDLIKEYDPKQPIANNLPNVTDRDDLKTMLFSYEGTHWAA